MSGPAPARIQLRRTKGFNLQQASQALNGLPAVKVTRPGPHGNPFRVGDFGIPDARSARERFYEWREGRVVGPPRPSLDVLRGKNLACFCRLCSDHAAGKPMGVECARCAPCHCDPLLILANPKESS